MALEFETFRRLNEDLAPRITEAAWEDREARNDLARKVKEIQRLAGVVVPANHPDWSWIQKRYDSLHALWISSGDDPVIRLAVVAEVARLDTIVAEIWAKRREKIILGLSIGIGGVFLAGALGAIAIAIG